MRRALTILVAVAVAAFAIWIATHHKGDQGTCGYFPTTPGCPSPSVSATR